MVTTLTQDTNSPTGLAAPNGTAAHPSTTPDASKDEAADAGAVALQPTPAPKRERKPRPARPEPAAAAAPAHEPERLPSAEDLQAELARMGEHELAAEAARKRTREIARARLSVLESERVTLRTILGLDAAPDEDGPGDPDEADTKADRPLLAVNGGRVAGPRRGGILRGAEAKPAAATRATAKGGAAKAKPAKAGRLARRSTADLKAQLDAIVKAVKAAGAEGLRAEHIREKLNLDRRELPRLLRMGRTSKRLRVRGSKRGATYRAT